ncbi:substrate-binding domain-containing protein [Tuwongella immobilis]|uniref:HTH araC/xylS-type domain-containing protein n=1 Tax=Tuwongella immobilis TaxID=692036 RepID=A0A6C2YUR1_9BACT|nr:substrate-binding domain-containing protein [Tuwongella immobilis]VIP05184.1 xylose operon regulatory protein : Transcriptional regulator, AraC family OS=Pirellula staleyi (strain ATCC 27377 / DSM 6068 / ICPB 4128) GN=Psta_3061 PE=4 SV=1: Peripla_BP_3: HTH_18 [Tuwongella immobilis]VTS07724.1 xylose operon regulatory protein : Transcriptional regulator, AraC family OS=Pirellula staleyi (strain ATCC 27377 / DSM 6068 / ICPB 4128) GN=Psta_3061 PE=4 SV=1: Peripla_BP_3: HTH_18 [Tuwongella immobilis]
MAAPPRRIALMLELEWPYKRHSEVFAGIQRYAEKQGWETIIDEFAHNTLLHSAPNATRYDGIVSRANRLLARRAAQLGIPVVNVWPSSPARELLPGVFPDSTAVGRLLAEHLIARGFRRFATLTSATNMDNQLEIQEFTRVVQAAGFGCQSSFIPQDPGRNVTNWRKTERLLTRTMQTWQPPMGVYVGQEVIGRLIVQLIRQHGWRVPDDISIIAGKNQEILCERPRPSLTSVEIGYDRIGYAAAELLDQLMSGLPAPADPIRIAPHGLVVRESTDFFAVDNPIVAAALRFIASHSHQRIGPDDVAQAVGTETRTLQNYFKKALARPIATEIRRVRIERAKRELAQGDRSLTAIAQNVGFGTIQRFYEVFQRELGLSPGEYRKQHQLPERR